MHSRTDSNRRPRTRAAVFLPWLTLAAACGDGSVGELALVARGDDPAWAIQVWSDSLSLDTEAAHARHRFATPETRSPASGRTVYEVSAEEITFQVEVEERTCQASDGTPSLPLTVTLAIGGRAYPGCGLRPALTLIRYHHSRPAFSMTAPAAWTRRDESRGDTTAVLWRAPAPDGAELTAIALVQQAGYPPEGLATLAGSFIRARYPGLTSDGELPRSTAGAARLGFMGELDAEWAADGPYRAVVDIEQETERLRLIGLVAPAGAEVWRDEDLLLQGLRWLDDPLRATPSEAPVPSSS